MKLPYENELYELRKWIDNTNTPLNMQFLHTPQKIQRIHQWIGIIAKETQTEYPFYAAMLPGIANILFQGNGMSPALVNPVAFGELMVFICHCSTAAEKAVKDVESRLREKFSELKPSAAVPSKIGDVIGALMSENGAFKFCDTTTTSGRDYRCGIQSLFEGIMAAYRNPAAHANLQYEKREAMEQIMLASQLMYVLDKQQL